MKYQKRYTTAWKERLKRVQDKILLTLSLCRKARKLTIGFDPVVEDMEKKKVSSIFVTKDLSKKSKKEILFIAGKYSVCVLELPYTMEEIARYLGKTAGIIAIEDKGFSDSLSKAVRIANEEE